MSAAPKRRIPTRSCVACRSPRPKRELLRIVRTPDGRVVADASGRLNGRGAYVCSDPACIETSIDRGLLARALETPVPSGLRAELAAVTAQTDDRRGGARGQE